MDPPFSRLTSSAPVETPHPQWLRLLSEHYGPGIYFLEVVLILKVSLQSGVIIPFVQGKEWRLREVGNLTSVAP